MIKKVIARNNRKINNSIHQLIANSFLNNNNNKITKI